MDLIIGGGHNPLSPLEITPLSKGAFKGVQMTHAYVHYSMYFKPVELHAIELQLVQIFFLFSASTIKYNFL